MISATRSTRPSLADVLTSCLDAVAGDGNFLDLPPVDRAVVVLVDGLGMSSLRARLGHARTMAGSITKESVAMAGFPTTTAANIATLTTGVHPGVHGLVGYTVLDAAHDRVVNQLTGWDAMLDPAVWQRARTVFEKAAARGIASVAIGQERYRDSGFTRAVLRGAEFASGRSIADRFTAAREAMNDRDAGIFYVYVPELDQTAHSHGWQSREWTQWLETLDAELGSFVKTLGPREGVLVTADHGVVDIPARSHVLFGEDSSLVDGIRFVAGEPRGLQLHLEPDATANRREALLARWRESEGARSRVLSRRDAIDQGWFGPAVDSEVAPRIGDILVAARKAVAYYDERAESAASRLMIGQHGSFSDEETSVPMLRFGAFARL